ncbi:hypothetical protein MBAV_003137 [Candidatus Magnetobacterium bavaricum]|uniref:Uncharacterized protein n=1 Tax=Candidatus Magnetobacterium bavaricum TaxID=29290 RepID=A0A0F3GVF3_9BACT|nr:hypothetical protein MBAV_003137 [Candidatus Magnetobacterium bavaricum]
MKEKKNERLCLPSDTSTRGHGPFDPVMLKRCLVMFVVFIMLYGCGYTVVNRGSLAFDTVRLGNITNVTVEPKLQDMLYEALNEHLMRRGVRVSDSSGTVIEGKINYFLSINRRTATSYYSAS